jgi:HSP20 family protein
MTNVAIEKVKDNQPRTLPIFGEIERRFNDIRQRAVQLFENRGREFGHELDDWLAAEQEVLGRWSAAELKEKDQRYELQLTLPGFEAKEVEVTATPSEIIVHAETKHETKKTEGKVVWSEFGASDVYRRFELPEPVDVDKINAALDKGILRITAAKAPAKAVETKRVEVAAA